jgi:hypothetical protein
MGIFDTRASSLRWFPLGLLAIAAVVYSGCETKKKAARVSSEQFLAPQKVGNSSQDSMRVLTTKLQLLKAVSPTTLDSELERQEPRAVPIGKSSANWLLLYEPSLGAIVSVNLCPECSNTSRVSRVELNYNLQGFEEELLSLVGGDPVLSTSVPAIELTRGAFRGWVVAYESTSNSLLAFRRLPDFRPFARDDVTSRNFGRGNGLFLNVLISGAQMRAQLGFAQPRSVARIFELGAGKLLVFFTGLRDVHLLDLRLEEENAVFDLDNPVASERPTAVIRGTFRTFPNAGGRPLAFLPGARTEVVTQNPSIDLASNSNPFTPIIVPADGSGLLFERETSSFLRVRERPGCEGNPDCEGQVELAVRGSVVQELLRRAGPFKMTTAFYDPSDPEILVMDQESVGILAYDYEARTVRLITPAENFIFRRCDAEPRQVFGGEETELTFARNDIRENRLAFDKGRLQIIGINYQTGVVVCVVTRADFTDVTNRQATDVRYIEVLPPDFPDRENVRVFDSLSTTLLEVQLEYTRLPVVQARN